MTGCIPLALCYMSIGTSLFAGWAAGRYVWPKRAERNGED